MPRRITNLLLSLIVVSILAIAQISKRPAPIHPVDGEKVFGHYCAPCHGADGRGKGPVSEALRQTVPDLTTLSRRNNGTFPTERVKNTILFGEVKLIPAHGSEQMPIWGPTFHEIEFDEDFGNVRLENVTNYIASLQRKQESPSKSGH
jgi:mono/diheme cytochrome c family protein